MAPPPGGGDWSQYEWQQWDLARAESRGKKAAEALAQSNDALETRLKALETRFKNTCAFYKSKFDAQERDHQELMVFSNEKLKKLEEQERDHQESMAMAD